MAIDGFRVSFVWEMQSSLLVSWSETFWNNAQDYAALLPRVLTLGTALNNIHGFGATNPYIRLAYVPKGKKIKGIDRPVEPFVLNGSYESDFPTTALLMAASDATGTVTRQWIKGIPDSIVQQAGKYVPGAGSFPGYLKAAQAILRNDQNGWCIRTLTAAAAPKPIRSISAELGTINAPAHGYTVGTTIKGRVSGITNYPAGNGLHDLYIQDVNTLQYMPWTPPTGLTIMLKKASVSNQIRALTPISAWDIERITKKNVGRPQRVLSGKSKSGK